LRKFLVSIALTVFATFAGFADDTSKFGQFIGHLDLRMNGDGLTAVLLAPFGYMDPTGKRWETPVGWKVDGASIPWPLWSIIGSPWTGKYREASVIHDYYCDTRTEPWQAVHKTFYTAMLANGVDDLQAKIMYIAVYRFGPRWDFDYTPQCPNCLTVPYHVDKFTPAFDEQEFDSLKSRLETGELSVDQAKVESDAAFSDQIKTLEIGKPILLR
jgi:hypothetical protein